MKHDSNKKYIFLNKKYSLFLSLLFLINFSSSVFSQVTDWITSKTTIAAIIVGGIILFHEKIYWSIANFFDRKAKESMRLKPIKSEEMIDVLKNSDYSSTVIFQLRNQKDLRQFEEVIDRELITHYKKTIQEALKHTPFNERTKWIQQAEEVLLFSKWGNLIGINEYSQKLYVTKDGTERGWGGTKYRALEELKSETEDFSTIEYIHSDEKPDKIALFLNFVGFNVQG